MTPDEIDDVVGIGFGPANIALAIAVDEEFPWLRCRFLEAKAQVEWQPGMLLAGTDIQNNPLRDLVTLRNPRSRFTFVNYLHEQGRLMSFLNLPLHFPLRKDYAGYIRWTAEQFAKVVDYGRAAVAVSTASEPVPHYQVRTDTGHIYLGRALVVGTGRTPYVPDLFGPLLGPNLFHSTEYRWRLAELLRAGRPGTVAVVGASQSAAEIVLDLHTTLPDCTVVTVMRGPGFRLKDTSPFSEEAFFPEFTDYYFDATAQSKADLDSRLRATNYSSVDGDVIETLYLRRYEDELDGRRRLLFQGNREITAARAVGRRIELDLRERHIGATETIAADAVVLATGFRDLGASPSTERMPSILAGIADEIGTYATGTIIVERDYAVPPASAQTERGPLFLNGLCESSHGLGDAGSFSLLSLRARTIATAISKRLDESTRPGRLGAD